MECPVGLIAGLGYSSILQWSTSQFITVPRDIRDAAENMKPGKFLVKDVSSFPVVENHFKKLEEDHDHRQGPSHAKEGSTNYSTVSLS